MKQNKTKIIFLMVFILLAVSIAVYYCKAIPKLDQFILEYLNARYTDTDYLSIAEKAEFYVYDIQKQSESTNVFARIYLNVKSENIPEWSQLSFYDLQFILSKEKGGYKICDVIVLDNKYQIPEAESEHVHDENCAPLELNEHSRTDSRQCG